MHFCGNIWHDLPLLIMALLLNIPAIRYIYNKYKKKDKKLFPIKKDE